MPSKDAGPRSTGRRLVVGAAWTYGAQVLAILAQFIYAALTSRLAAPHEFGSYSIALISTGLLTLLASTGVAQSVGRALVLDRTELSRIFTYSCLTGLGFAGAAFGLAPLLGSAWGEPSAAAAIRLLAINVATAPLLGLGTGALRRSGRFKGAAVATLAANLFGMAVGGVIVTQRQDSVSLAAAPVIAQSVVVLAVFLMMRERPRLVWRLSGGESLSFTWRLGLVSICQYFTSVMPKLAVSSSVGAATIGQWNRAEVLSILPFQQLQAAILPVVYPEFRHDRGGSQRAAAKWADMLALVAWTTAPAGVAGAVLLPTILPVVLGNQWHEAAFYCIPLALTGGIQPATILLASAIEAIGQFRVIWIANSFSLCVQIVAIIAVFFFHSAWPAVCSLFFVHVVSHSFYAFWAHAHGYLNLSALIRNYVAVAMGCFAIGVLAGSVLVMIQQSGSARLSGAVCLLAWAICICALLGMRGVRRLPPVVLAQRLGIIRSLDRT